MQRPPPVALRPARILMGAAAAALGLAALHSCSLIVDQSGQQCAMDSDCMSFPGAHCDMTQGVCVGETTTGSTGSSTTTTSSTSSTSSTTSSTGGKGCDVDGGIDGGGCYDDSLATCPVSSDPGTGNAELLNACATGCVVFDNSMKVPALGPGGTLPPLPTNGPDGGF